MSQTIHDLAAAEFPGPLGDGLNAGAPVRAVRACMYTAESQSGHARYTRDLMLALAEAGPARGVDVALVTSRDLAPPYRTDRYPTHAILPPLTDRGAFRTRLGWGVSRVSHYLGRERTFLRWVEGQCGLGLVHFQEYTPWLAPAHFPRLRRRGVAVVQTVHNLTNHGHASRSYMQVSRRCWRSAWRSCSCLLVHTPGLRDALADELGPGHPPVFVTPHAVWEERTGPPVPPRLDPGAPARLLFFGVLRPNKGLHVMLRAMAGLPGCVLSVVGQPVYGGYFDEIRALADALPPGRVEFVSRYVDEPEIAGIFDAAHLVVLPYTRFESQSGVLHQALAHGRAVVASGVGGLGESVREWGVGEVVPPDDVAALAEGVRRALRPERFEEATGAVARVRGDLYWAKMAEATLDAYRAVLD